MHDVFMTDVAPVYLDKRAIYLFDSFCPKWRKMDQRLKKETQHKIRVVQSSLLMFATDEYMRNGGGNFTLPTDIAKSIVDGTYYV